MLHNGFVSGNVHPPTHWHTRRGGGSLYFPCIFIRQLQPSPTSDDVPIPVHPPPVTLRLLNCTKVKGKGIVL